MLFKNELRKETMIKQNLIISIRSLLNHRKYAFINIFGLAIGLACFILITIWVQDELSYDKFYEDADNIHIVFRKENDKRAAVSSKLLAPTIREEIPEIIDATCFLQLSESFNSLFQYEEKSFVENIALADNQFLSVFSFSLQKGDPGSVFTEPNSVLMTEKMSQKYFGEEDAIGKSLSVSILGQKKLLKVAGIMQNIPHNSHIQSELILPIEFAKCFGINWDVWYNQSVTTYIRTQDKVSTEELEKKILACKEQHFHEENINYSVLPITKIHLNTSDVEFFSSSGDIKYVYIFSAIAVIILLIACLNYMNLSNALSLKRSKETGIKKTLGCKRRQLVQQYFAETFVLVLIALFFAVILAQMCLPVLNSISAKSLFVPYFDLIFIGTLVGVVLITSLLSGFYPALFMSGFQAVKVLKGKFVSSPRSLNIRKGLIVFQFVLSILIIIGTITVSKQLKFIQSTNLGYDKEHVICVPVKGDINNKYEAFKNELLQSTSVLNVSRSASMDIKGMGNTYGIDWPGKERQFKAWILNVDTEFAETYGLKMNDGRFYSPEFAKRTEFVINQTAAKEMGFETPLGHELTVWGRKGTIVGVTDDFNFNSLHNKVEPLILLMPRPDQVSSRCPTISMRIKPNSMPQSLEDIGRTWKTFFPDETFDYYFIDDKLESSYLAEFRMGTLFKYFSMLVIFIACLGLYGLTAFTIEQKSKEIGVYKVMGATVPDIIILFSKGYMFWIVTAFIIACPVAYYAMNKWLENFAYKTAISWWVFALAGVLALGIALLTVSWQSWRAATRNPVEALRYE
uniref:ABC transporter permease n=1 Tax=uncultured Draconibacterium sp. TaxID=1573823 RepID=UPI0032165476